MGLIRNYTDFFLPPIHSYNVNGAVILQLLPDYTICVKMVMESKKRTLVKTTVYRGSITLLLFILLWAFTDDIYQTSMITLVFNVAAMIIYYFHERIWGKINWKNPITSFQYL